MKTIKAKKEKPILFSSEMVRAVIEGRKTETRRIAKSGKAPYKISDILYVRETWAKTKDGMYLYKADPMYKDMQPGDFGFYWKPSIHMPESAARIFLEVIKVRKEKLQDITEDGAQKEGVEKTYPFGFRTAFKKLWDRLNKKTDYNWDANPDVWVIEFKRSKLL
ncbi:EVE domain-containing protein [Treponema putidum]|uniref:EVE domain-containing protein n=1 Tax=Treponema putidum TaxID=221027 RepID=A0ABY5HTP2_9SPIR|nr:EVE domain-containing protein [Treponema putidum]UTY27613.1 EVE domain-containing protein [Treponema putidum]